MQVGHTQEADYMTNTLVFMTVDGLIKSRLVAILDLAKMTPILNSDKIIHPHL